MQQAFTVQQLIEKLQALPPDLPLVVLHLVDGCRSVVAVERDFGCTTGVEFVELKLEGEL